MKTYSYDLRERVVQACDDGWYSRTELAELFGVSTAWIRRLLQRRRETGSFAALPHAGGPAPKMNQERRERLLVLVSEQPDATLEELRERLGAPVHLGTIGRTLATLGLTVKKSPPGRRAGPSGRAAEAGRLARPDPQHRPGPLRVPR